MPLQSPLPEVVVTQDTIHNYVMKDMHRFYEDVAIIESKSRRCITYGEAERLVKSVSAGLQHVGMVKGDVALVSVPNSPEFVLFFLAVLRAGGIASGASTLYTKHSLTAKSCEIQPEVEFSVSRYDAAFLNELLKCLYSLGSYLSKQPSPADAWLPYTEDASQLIDVLIRLIFAHVADSSTSSDSLGGIKVEPDTVASQAINLMLCPPIDLVASKVVWAEDDSEACRLYDGYNTSVLDQMVRFLERRTDSLSSPESDAEIIPILSLLVNLAQASKLIRKYLRFQILPPLQNLEQRPEQGDSLRAKLVRLMTVVTPVNNFAAGFLFILCRQDVNRFIKYTGFGNAAGLLANFGLLGQINRHTDDSEESETEEYSKALPDFDPVLGCKKSAKDRANPLDGLSEEQKEHEVMKLVDEMDRLISSGVIKPARMTEDGRVEPLRHVLQLQESESCLAKKANDFDKGST